MKLLVNRYLLLFLACTIYTLMLNAQTLNDSIETHTFYTDIARGFLSNSIELTHEYQFHQRWSFFSTLGYLYSTSGHSLYGQEGILYCNGSLSSDYSANNRMDKGIIFRGGLNYTITPSFLISSILGYEYSYYRKKLVSHEGHIVDFSDCPPDVGYGRTYYSKMDQYYLLLESSKRHIISLDIGSRLRFTFRKHFILEFWTALGLQHRFENRKVLEEIAQHFDSRFQPQFCSQPGCTQQISFNKTYLHSIAGVKVGYKITNIKKK